MSHEAIEQELRRLMSPEFADGGACAWDLYRYAAGEATAGEAAEFEAHLATCEECQVDLAAFRAEREEPPRTRAAAWRWAAGGLAAAAVLALGLFIGLPGEVDRPGRTVNLRPKGPSASGEGPATGFRVKGPVRLQVAVQRGSKRFVASAGQTFETGDVLGFFYTALDETWPVILFCDTEGNITQVFPPPGAAVSVPAGVERPLPVSAVVEEGRTCEWIVGFFSSRQPSMDTLQSALREAVRGRSPDCALLPMDLEDVTMDVTLLRRESEER